MKLKEKIINKFSESREERIKLLGEEHAKEIEKRIFLQSIDLNWKSHIQYLEQLRQVIGLDHMASEILWSNTKKRRLIYFLIYLIN